MNWTAKKSETTAKSTIKESSLARFRSGLLSSVLSQPLLSMTIDPSVKKFWTAVRMHQQSTPICHHYHTACSCGAQFSSTSTNWQCGHPKLIGEMVAYEDATLFDSDSPPTPITTFLRICQSCGSLSRSSSLEDGVFNYDERHLLTVPFLIRIRNSLTDGTPLHIIITSWAKTLKDLYDCSISAATIPRIKAAFLAFEALSDHGEHAVCHLCKDDPAHLIFDGNAKLVFKIAGTFLLKSIFFFKITLSKVETSFLFILHNRITLHCKYCRIQVNPPHKGIELYEKPRQVFERHPQRTPLFLCWCCY